MKIYKISCYSTCGSYFANYLQSVTVIADSKETALSYCKEWLEDNHRKFIYDEKEWEIEVVSENVNSGVIDYYEDSDY